MLVDGKWQGDWHPFQATDKKGAFVRQTSTFRNWITPDGSAGRTGKGGFQAESGRYHLYVALICPWASRTLMVRSLKGLEDHISVSIVSPKMGPLGWEFGGFEGASEDHLYGSTHLHQLYIRADQHVNGRASVPVLWDKKTDQMVNNESADIIEMLNSAFDHLGVRPHNLRPEKYLGEMEDLNQRIYHKLNNGVYRCGFAKSQQAYEEAYEDVFSMLDELEQRLDGKDYLFGDQLSESDVRLFVTLVRFDAAYYGLFKCNRNQLRDFPNLSAYTRRIYHTDGIAKTVDLDHIKAGYYSIKALNPSEIIPIGSGDFFMK